MKTILRPEPGLVFFDAKNAGLRLEIGADIDGMVRRLATIVADDADESLWFEFPIDDDRCARIPLAVVEDAIRAAKADVHSEAWYDRLVDD